MRSFVGQKPLKRILEENMNSKVSVYERMAAMFEVNSADMVKAIPVILSGDALLYYLGHVKHCTSYEEIINELHSWYNNAAKRAKILTKW